MIADDFADIAARLRAISPGLMLDMADPEADAYAEAQADYEECLVLFGGQETPILPPEPKSPAGIALAAIERADAEREASQAALLADARKRHARLAATMISSDAYPARLVAPASGGWVAAAPPAASWTVTIGHGGAFQLGAALTPPRPVSGVATVPPGAVAPLP